jgi:Fic family protein
VLNILYLIQAELLTLPILCLSRHIIAHKANYYRLLLDTTRNVTLVEKDIAQRQTASRYLKELTAIGVLREVQAGKEKLFIYPLRLKRVP